MLDICFSTIINRYRKYRCAMCFDQIVLGLRLLYACCIFIWVVCKCSLFGEILLFHQELACFVTSLDGIFLWAFMLIVSTSDKLIEYWSFIYCFILNYSASYITEVFFSFFFFIFFFWLFRENDSWTLCEDLLTEERFYGYLIVFT